MRAARRGDPAPAPAQPSQPRTAPPARHNTTALPSAPYAPTAAAAPPPPPASTHAPAQLQHLERMFVPLPSFPEVPHTAPQAYPEPERKEALLIDL